MKRKILCFIIMIALFAAQSVFAINYTEDDANPLLNGAQIPAGNHTFNNTGEDRIITIGGDLIVSPGATITFVGVEQLVFANGSEFDCGDALGNGVTISGFAADPGGGARNLNDNPVTIILQNGSVGLIENTTFQLFGVAINAVAGSNLSLSGESVFDDCDICVRDETANTDIVDCIFQDFWWYCIEAIGATGFEYTDNRFDSAMPDDRDIDGNPTDLADCNNNGVHVSQIRLDEDSEGTISDCVFEHEHVGNNTELPASIFCEDSSPIVQSSTFKLLLPQNEREILVLLSCFLDVKFFSNKI